MQRKSGKPKAVMAWSGGKDSAFCLYKVRQEGIFDVRYLLTTLNQQYRRISMHGIREELLDHQAAAIGLPLLKVWVSEGTNAEYERQMAATLEKVRSEGVRQVIFGDIFLEDLRAYREQNLARVGMEAAFPLWKSDTGRLIREFVDCGFRTIVCCTNVAFLGNEWLGREIDGSFIHDLPSTVDPCGENGEYHTFCHGGPVFHEPVVCIAGEKAFRPLDLKTATRDAQEDQPVTQGFWFCDLGLPKQNGNDIEREP